MTNTLTAAQRVAALEHALGDPWSEGNPLSFRNIVAADVGRELLPAGVALLEKFGLAAEFVPVAHGGRLASLDELGQLTRVVMRRDASLLVGCGLSSFTGSAVVWVSGSDAQNKLVADRLLANLQLGIVCPEAEHANQYFADHIGAVRTEQGLLVDGLKRAVNHAETAGVILAFAEAGPGGSEGHALLLIDRADIGTGTISEIERVPSAGTRGVPVGGLRFENCQLPEAALIGHWGAGFMAGVPAFPMLHAALASALVGLGDTALRLAAQLAVDELRHLTDRVRKTLATSLAALLTADAMSLVAARAIHVVPAECHAIAALAKYMVPKMIAEMLYRLSVVMGDRFHASNGQDAALSKAIRDLSAMTFGHVGSALCHSTVAPQIGRLAETPWTAEQAAPPSLFEPGGELPEIDIEALVHMGGRDGIAATIDRVLQDWPAAATGPGCDTVRSQCEQLRQLAFDLRQQWAASTAAATEEAAPGTTGENAAVRSDEAVGQTFASTERYALLLAAACAIGVWAAAQGNESFLADASWLVIALAELLDRLGGSQITELDAGTTVAVAAEVVERTVRPRSYDIYATPLFG